MTFLGESRSSLIAIMPSFYLFEYEGTSVIALAQQVSQDRDVESIHQLKGVSHERHFTGHHCPGRC